ncbi:hypothetical protein THASP1DRAFT_33316, partial [Thamnocephalis sphaerospora]
MEPGTPTRSTRSAAADALFSQPDATPERSGAFDADEYDVSLPTPHILRLADTELRERLRSAYRLLSEKDKDLHLAAELGQGLLEANAQLKREYEAALLRAFEQQAALERTLVDASGNKHNSNDSDANQEASTVAEELALERRMHRRVAERVDELTQVVFELEQGRAELHRPPQSAVACAFEASQPFQYRLRHRPQQFPQYHEMSVALQSPPGHALAPTAPA